jgi:hypothetical protein
MALQYVLKEEKGQVLSILAVGESLLHILAQREHPF